MLLVQDTSVQLLRAALLTSRIMPKCPKCKKEVYFMEQALALGKTWHKSCLKCTECNKTLTIGSFSDRENMPYCNPCYQKKFGQSGFRAGAGAGAANSYQWQKK